MNTLQKDLPDTPSTKPAPMLFFRDDLRGKELRKLYRDIFLLATPVFIGQGFNAMVGFISRIIIGKLGEKAFNSINVGMMIFFIIITVVAAIGVGTTSLVAQNWGRGDKRAAGSVLQQSLIFGAMLSINIMIFGLAFHNVLFDILGTDPVTSKMGAQFLFWMFLGVPLLTPGFFLASALRGAGDTRTPMFAGLVMGALSLYLGYGLILGKFGLPRLEVTGAALSIDLSFFVFTLILAFLVFTKRTVLRVPKKGWSPEDKIGKSIMKIGVPSAAEWTLIQIGILVYVAIISNYGADALAGYFTGIAVLSLAQTATFGFQTAATTLVGQAVGARDLTRAESALRRTSMLGFASMGCLGIMTALIATPSILGVIFNNLSLASLDYSRAYIILLIYLMPLMGLYFSIAGGLRGAGDTIWPLISSSIGIYGGRLVFALVVYHLFHPPVYLIWCSMFPDLIIRIVLIMVRLRGGKWKTGRV